MWEVVFEIAVVYYGAEPRNSREKYTSVLCSFIATKLFRDPLALVGVLLVVNKQHSSILRGNMIQSKCQVCTTIALLLNYTPLRGNVSTVL